MTEQQYNNSIAIYNPNGGHRAGKIYDIKGTNDLTVTGGGGTRFNNIGQLERVPVISNIEPHSYDLITSGFWNPLEGATYALDQVGIKGLQNTAVTITDSSTTLAAEVKRGLSSLLSGIHRFSTWIKKDDNESVFPEVYCVFRRTSDSTNMVTLLNLNTKTGAFAHRANLNDNQSYVLDRGDWWEVVIISSEPTDRLVTIAIRPAISNTISGSFGYSPSHTRSIIVGHVGLSNSSTVDETPIITNGTTITEISPKINYNSGKPAFLIEPTRTNHALYSYDLTVGASHIYRNLGTSTQVTLNQVGITGQPNTATLVEDLSTSDYGELTTGILSYPDGIGKMSIWIKKDSNQSRFPEIYTYFRLNGGVLENNTIHLNTATGAFTARSGLQDSNVTVLDRGDWWEMIHMTKVITNQTKIHIRPALGSTIATYSNTATGSIIVGHVGISQSSIVDETPIITNGSVVTRTKSHYSTSIPTTVEGGIYVNFTHRSIGDNENRYLVILTDSANFVASRNAIFINNNSLNSIMENDVSTNIMTLVEGQEYKIFLSFKNGDCKLTVNGSVVDTNTNTVTTTKNSLVIGSYGSPFAENRNIYSSIHDFRILQPITDQEAIALTTV